MQQVQRAWRNSIIIVSRFVGWNREPVQGATRPVGRCTGRLAHEQNETGKEGQHRCNGHARKQYFGGFSHVPPNSVGHELSFGAKAP
jgi:hypothetical protein